MIPRFATLADASRVEEICTHPEVRKWHVQEGKDERFDVSRWLTPTNMVVLVDDGCFLSNWLGDQTFGVHTHILPQGRGKQALVNGGLALMLAFLRSNAETFLTSVPANNRAAAWFTRAMGFRKMFRQPSRWWAQGRLWDVDHWRLDVDDWILQGHLEVVGQAFHEEVRRVEGHVEHGDDPVHEAYVGALCAMIDAGKVEKGLKIYNRWARASGYVPITRLAKDPLTLDARDFIVKVEEGGMKIEAKEYSHA